MATKMKRRTATAPKTAAAALKTQDQNKQAVQDNAKIGNLTLEEFVDLTDSRIAESVGFWDGKDFGLKKAQEENQKYYHGLQAESDSDTAEKALDNRIFSSIRSILPYVTSQITQPDVNPSDNTPEAVQFAQDLERALFKHAQKQKVRMKMKFAVQDAMIIRRGYLKLRYDGPTNNFCFVEYVPAESIIMDHKAKPYEEPRYFRHKLSKTVDDLVTMFPENEAKILSMFKIDDNTPSKEMYKDHDVNEDWVFHQIDGQLDLCVVWSYNKQPIGYIKDPNWNYDGNNFIDSHMVPIIPVNILSDGRTMIDKTSFVEQSRYSQDIVDARTKQISKSASVGSTGMPVVDTRAMADDQAQFITFDTDQVLELDVESTGVDDINKAFTTWKSDPLQPEVFEDKADARSAIDNAFGTNDITRGAQSTKETLGQDILLRDQSQGRQKEIIDAIDVSTERLYLLMAQFLLIYGDQKMLFRVSGKNTEFDYVIMHTNELDVDAEIGVVGGTSMPIDNEQRRATADKAAQQAMIDPLSYWQIMDEGHAEEVAKRTITWLKSTDPTEIIKDMTDDEFDRDAYVDIDSIRHGNTPEYRENLEKCYFDYLNKFALSGALDPENPKMDMETKQRIADFINAQLVRGSKMLGMAETQLPTADDVASHNASVDEQNAAEAAALKGMPAPGGGPAGAPGAPPAGPPAGPPPMPPIAKGATPPPMPAKPGAPKG
jgi:hypothetical protein